MGIYKDLLNEIELHKNYYEAAALSYEYYDKILYSNCPKMEGSVNYDGMPKGSKVYMDVCENITQLHKWLIKRETEESILRELNYRKSEIDKCINNIEDLTVKVSQLRDMGLTQEQVAELVDRSPRQIQNIEARKRKVC